MKISFWIVGMMSVLIACKSNPKINYRNSSDGISVCKILNDSVYLQKYTLNKYQIAKKSYYEYTSESDSFILIYDSISKDCQELYKKDTTNLLLDTSRFFIINSKVFNVSKYIRDPDRIDASISFFFSPEVGLILRKADSWRFGIFPLNYSNNDTSITANALLYNVLTRFDLSEH